MYVHMRKWIAKISKKVNKRSTMKEDESALLVYGVSSCWFIIIYKKSLCALFSCSKHVNAVGFTFFYRLQLSQLLFRFQKQVLFDSEYRSQRSQRKPPPLLGGWCGASDGVARSADWGSGRSADWWCAGGAGWSGGEGGGWGAGEPGPRHLLHPHHSQGQQQQKQQQHP